MEQKQQFTVWSVSTRFCNKCYVEPARLNDWLCEGCREELEKTWTGVRMGHPYQMRLLESGSNVFSVNA